MSQQYAKYLFTPQKRLSAEQIQAATKVPLLCSEDFDLAGIRFDIGWYRKPCPITGEEYALPCDEMYVFMGSDLSDPNTLGGAVSFTVAGETYRTQRSCLVFFPAYVPHGNLRLERVDRPIFGYSAAMGREFEPLMAALWRQPESREESAYLLHPDQVRTHHLENDEHTTDLLWSCSEGFAGRSFYHNLRFFKPYAEPYNWVRYAHAHPQPELLGVFGCDPDRPYDLDAKVDVVMGSETYILEGGSGVYAPPYLPHCPMTLHRVDKPYFFTAISPDFPEYIHLYMEPYEENA